MEQATRIGFKLKNKLVEFLVLTIIWTTFYIVVRFFMVKFRILLLPYLLAGVISMFLFTFTYKKLWSAKTLKNLWGVLLLFLIFGVIPFSIPYGKAIYKRNKILYSYLTAEKKRGWKGKIHQADDSLGFKTIPGARGFMMFHFGDDIPFAIDSDGFRIPVTDTAKNCNNQGADILFLGCSFTFGDACLAEETYPYYVSKATGLSYMNAGVCSNGLSQMVLAAEKLIPRFKPRYIVVQHSPWLVQRSMSNFAPTHYGTMPNPYFIENEREMGIHKPIYVTQMFNLDFDAIKKETELEFFWHEGMAYQLKEDWLIWSSKIKLVLGLEKQAASDAVAVEVYGYDRIYKAARANNAKVIILSLCWNDGFKELKKHFVNRQEVYYANADSLLNEYLAQSKSNSFSIEFTHWRMNGNDSINIDGHPNALANQLISQSIVPFLAVE
jgi:hypothetical protein